MSALKHLCDADRHFAWRIVNRFHFVDRGRAWSADPNQRTACAAEAERWLAGQDVEQSELALQKAGE